MKKVLLFAAALAFSAATWASDEVTVKVAAGSADVELVNETAFVAFQMDITLPGATVAESGAIESNVERLAKGANVTIAGADTETPFVVVYNELAGNKVRVVAYNLGNHEIQANAGKLFTLSFTGDVNADEVVVDNVLFVDTNLVEQAIAAHAEAGGAAGNGDIDNNGEVDVFDVVALANIVLGNVDPSYNLKAADVDGNGDTDVFDIVALATLILG